VVRRAAHLHRREQLHRGRDDSRPRGHTHEQAHFRGAGAAVIGGPESNAGKIRDAVKRRVAAAPSAATRGVPRHSACRFATFPRGFCPSGVQRNPLLGGGEHADRTPVARNDCKPCGHTTGAASSCFASGTQFARSNDREAQRDPNGIRTRVGACFGLRGNRRKMRRTSNSDLGTFSCLLRILVKMLYFEGTC
jgi:hypothetical protein